MSLVEAKQALWDFHEFAGINIRMRKSDGYFNAKDMCKIKNKLVKDYFRNKQAQEFIQELEKEVGENSPLPIINEVGTGINENRGTWIHPDVAIHLAMWISPKFSAKVVAWSRRFMQGDITLVKDIVERHDQLNNTKSDVLITTLSNQIEEYKSNIISIQNTNKNLELNSKNLELTNKNLDTIVQNLQIQIEKINEMNCDYCNKRYSSAGITRHLKNCPDKKIYDFKALILLPRFMSYIELINEYEIENIILELKEWTSNKPCLIIKKLNKSYSFNIYLNESRWKVIRFLDKYISIPLTLLLSENSINMFQENEKNLELIQQYFNSDIDFTLEQEFKQKLGLIQDDDDDDSSSD